LSVLVPLSALGQQRDIDVIQLDPVGTWRCVVYGHPTFGDERVVLSFAPDQSARIARSADGGTPTWSPMSRWQVENGLMSFADTRTGRKFTADLERETLSGEWRTLSQLGGWWCAASDADEGPGVDILSTVGESETGEPTKRLIPYIMATPTFPRRAVRQAKEGRVVLCFVVEPSGEIFEPEFVELSDEIFRATSLDALMRSRYQPWDPRADGGARPACRSFIYRLDYRY
jgi:hypothetical protein